MLDFDKVENALIDELKREFSFNDDQAWDVLMLLNDCEVDFEKTLEERYPDKYEELKINQLQEEIEEQVEASSWFGTMSDVIGL